MKSRIQQWIFGGALLFCSSGFTAMECVSILNDQTKSSATMLQEKTSEALKELDAVLLGQEEVKRLAVIGLITGGHVLFEGPTGTGKTQLSKSMGKVFGLETARTTFNPEITPSKLVGYKVQNLETGLLEKVPGDMEGAQIYHADELNRATSRTINALLEGMEEYQITLDGEVTYLESLFTVLATQNPLSQTGTIALSEALLDRFMFKVESGYLSGSDLLQLGRYLSEGVEMRGVRQILTAEELLLVKKEVMEVHLPRALLTRMGEVLDTLNGQQSSLDSNSFSDIAEVFVTRGYMAWIKAAKARAYLEGRSEVSQDDVVQMAYHVLNHRIKLKKSSGSAGSVGQKNDERIRELIKSSVEQFFKAE